jgi:hypothetical protein
MDSLRVPEAGPPVRESLVDVRQLTAGPSA